MKKRVEWVDTVKAIGIFLVFYGHYVENIGKDYDSAVGLAQFKFIYSFHIPLFFVLSGFFFKESSNKSEKIITLFYQRIIPVLTFGVLFMPLWLVYNKAKFHAFLLENIVDKALHYLGGDPQLNFITWFLICLFTAEAALVVIGLKSTNKSATALFGICFLLLGFFITKYSNILTSYTKIATNFWYVHESIVAIGFYLLGNWLYSFINSFKNERSLAIYLAVPITFALLMLSNAVFSPQSVIIMSISTHGDLLPFIINSLLGTLLIISIGYLLPPTKIATFLGANTLILLGLDGFFFHFINRHVVKFTLINKSLSYITLNCTIATLISLALCYPFIYLFNKYVPQLFGKPHLDGPLLKPLNQYVKPKSLQSRLTKYALSAAKGRG